MHANKGVYALLLGSGISREAGVPTGWGIIEDLVKRVALLEDAVEQCAPDPEAGYQQRFGDPPNYSELLAKLAPSPAERQQLLREFFEPTEEEREEGRKVPTAAHHAIADLVARGYVRVIVTTNFDRLMEQALEGRHVAPTVIFSADAAQGALPLAHSPCTIVKVHGDYRDTRILNTVEELEGYDPAIDTVLDQILDEYGLIVSGWSAEWDTALRAAIERASNRRFSTYWTYPRNLTGAARDLISHRQAIEIPNAPADAFFQKLSEDVTSLEERSEQHDLTPELAARTVKRYLPDPMQRIRLHDLIVGEVDRVRDLILAGGEFRVNSNQYGGAIYEERMSRLEAESATLMAMFGVAGYWCDETNRELWLRALQRLATFPHPPGQYVFAFESLRRYPALLASYAAGIAALAAGNMEFLVSMLTEPAVTSKNRPGPVAFVLAVNTLEVLEFQRQKELPGIEALLTPFSQRLWLLPALRRALRTTVSDDEELLQLFDQYEYLSGLIGWDQGDGWAPVGCFVWRCGVRGDPRYLRVCTDMENEITNLGGDHPLVTTGAFDGSVDRMRQVKAEYDQSLRRWAF